MKRKPIREGIGLEVYARLTNQVYSQLDKRLSNQLHRQLGWASAQAYNQFRRHLGR